MPVEIRYMRSDRDTVNGLTAFKLLTNNTTSAWSTGPVDAYSKMGIRVWKRHSDGSEDEITAGTPVAQITIPAGYTTSRSATYTPNLTTLVSTDNIVIRVYVLSGTTWILLKDDTGAYDIVFHTEQLNTTILNNVQWTVIYWFSYIPPPIADWTIFIWGYILRPSCIENFTYGEAAVAAPVGDGLSWVQ